MGGPDLPRKRTTLGTYFGMHRRVRTVDILNVNRKRAVAMRSLAASNVKG